MMKKLALAACALLYATPATFAQTTTAPVGQTAGGAINASVFANNSDSAGFNEMALSNPVAVPATSTAQAAWSNGAVVSGTVIAPRTTVITACSASTGPTLPAVQRYVPITLINRSGGSCLIFPSVGATVETAPGTSGAVNAPFTMLTNTDVIFRPVSPTSWVQ